MNTAQNTYILRLLVAIVGLCTGCGVVASVREGEAPCTSITQCESNRVCRFTAPGDTGVCVVPSGRCESQATVQRDCYPNARCVLQSPASDGGSSGGMCSFAPPSRQGFAVPARITLRHPADNELAPAVQDVSFQWEPPTAQVGVPTVTVAVVMDTVPVLSATTRQISNRTHIRWIWSSADPGGPVQDGTVPFHFGRRGVSASGELGAQWNRDSLAAGTYVWFVYAIAQGQVVASSDVLKFSVSSPTALPARCESNADCVVAAELPEMVGCVRSRCRRRCASDLDCTAYGGTCDTTEITGDGTRHGAFCALPPGAPFGG